MYDDQDRNRDITNKKIRRARFRLLRPLGQGHNIVVYVRRSPTYTKIFKKLAEKMILIDNCTR